MTSISDVCGGGGGGGSRVIDRDLLHLINVEYVRGSNYITVHTVGFCIL